MQPEVYIILLSSIHHLPNSAIPWNFFVSLRASSSSRFGKYYWSSPPTQIWIAWYSQREIERRRWWRSHLDGVRLYQNFNHGPQVSIYLCWSGEGGISISLSFPYLSRPSKLAQEEVRASYGTPTRRTIVSGRMIGRKDKVCAQMAVRRMTGFSGWHREPPAARLYAVDPVGVATQTPSACTVVKCSPSPNISREDMAIELRSFSMLAVSKSAICNLLGWGPRSTTMSLRISYFAAGLCVNLSSASIPTSSSTRFSPCSRLLCWDLMTVPSNRSRKLTVTPSRNAVVSVSRKPS